MLAFFSDFLSSENCKKFATLIRTTFFEENVTQPLLCVIMTVPIITMKRYFLQQGGINTDTQQNGNVRNLTKGKYTRGISQFESAKYKKNSYY